MTDRMEFQVFGPMRMRSRAHEATVGGRLQRVLLGVLLCRANTVVSSDALAEAMWGAQGNDRSTPNLHIHVHRLRRLLPEPERLTSEPGGYFLSTQPDEVDIERFETLLDQGTTLRPHAPAKAAELIRKALDLWTGPPFEGMDASPLIDKTYRLEERRLVALQELYTAELARGRHTAVLGELVEQVHQNPLHEHLHSLLMIAHHHAGQPGRALSAYHRARHILREELGQDPGPELRRIEQCVLAGHTIDLGPQESHTTPPSQLPHKPPGFTGRHTELAALDELLDEHHPGSACVISGTGGVGKTTLATHWAHRVDEHFPDGQLYVDLRGYGPHTPMRPEDALAVLLRGLGADASQIPTGVDECAAHYRTLVAGRRILVVLDNAHTTEQVRPLLPGGSTAQTLITSRNALPGLVARDGARRIPLGRLPHAEAIELLRSLIGTQVEEAPEAAVELVEQCARLPLALRVAAELVNTGPSHDIATLTGELADQQRTLDVLDAGDDATTSVRTVLSWSYRQLPQEAARALRLLSTHPGHDFDVPVVAALTDLDLPSTRSVLRTLLRAHLVEETTAGRCRMHDLLRAYAADLCRTHDTDHHAAATRLFEHYLYSLRAATETAHGRVGPPPTHTTKRPPTAIDFADARHAARWLEDERATLVRLTQHASRTGKWRSAVDLAGALRRHLSMGGHHNEALAVHHTALEAAHHLGDLPARAAAHRCVGSVHRRLGLLDRAMEHMHHSYECLDQADQPQDLLFQVLQLGVMSIFLGRYGQAFQHLRLAERRSAELGEQGRFGRVAAHAYQGFLLHLLRRDQEALTHLTRADDLAGDSPARRTDVEAITGWIHTTLGHTEQARQHLERARDLAQETGNRFVQAWVHPLALAYRKLGMRREAFACAENCLAVALEFDERLVEPSARNTLGELYRYDGAPEDGLAQHRAALTAAGRSGIRYCEANAHAGIGDAHELLGDRERARQHWERAVLLFDRIGISTDKVRARLLTV